MKKMEGDRENVKHKPIRLNKLLHTLAELPCHPLAD